MIRYPTTSNFSPRISAIPVTRPDWGWGERAPMATLLRRKRSHDSSKISAGLRTAVHHADNVLANKRTTTHQRPTDHPRRNRIVQSEYTAYKLYAIG